MHKRHLGYYTGRWNWFYEQGNTADGVWPLPANYDYTARVTTPCGGVLKESTFRILTGEADTNDTTDPTEAKLTITGNNGGGNTKTVSLSEGVAKRVTVEPNTPSEVKASGFDRQGVKNLEITNVDGLLASPTSETATEKVPIPPELNLKTELGGLVPYEITSVNTWVYNFADNYSTAPTMQAEGKHPQPSISRLKVIFPDGVEKSHGYSNYTLKIKGEDLYYSNLTTEVRFELTTPNATVTDSYTMPSGDASETKLQNVEIPSGLEGYRGDVKVTVATISSDGDEKESLSTSFSLLDRKVPFVSITGDQVDKNKEGCPLESPGPGAVTGIDVNTGSTHDYVAVIHSNGRSNVSQEFDLNDEGMGGVEILDTNDTCRTVAFLTHNGNDAPPQFTLVWYYFPRYDNVPPESHNVQRVSYYSDVGFTPSVLKLFASTDGSLVAHSQPTTQEDTDNDIEIYGTIYDLLDWDDLARTDSKQAAVCTDVSSCSISSSLVNPDLMRVEVTSGTNTQNLVERELETTW